MFELRKAIEIEGIQAFMHHIIISQCILFCRTYIVTWWFVTVTKCAALHTRASSPLPSKLFPFDAAQSCASSRRDGLRPRAGHRRRCARVPPTEEPARCCQRRCCSRLTARHGVSCCRREQPSVDEGTRRYWRTLRSTAGRHLLRRVRSSSIVTCKLLASFFFCAKNACAWCGPLLSSCTAPAIFL